MLTMTVRQYSSSRLTKAAAVTALAAALVAGGASAEQSNGAHSVPPVEVPSAGLADLEGAFWACDYIATTRGTANVDITACTAVYDAMKERKFGGDFDKLLAWWQQNKVVRHDALAATEAMRRPR
jgi:hypothetical protein